MAPRPTRHPLPDQLRALRRVWTAGDRGVAVILTTLLLVPLVVLTGFAVDSGAWYAQAERMQRAADAAALASVVWVDDDDPNLYIDVAREAAEKNGFAHDPPRTIVDVARIGQAQVEVTITRDGSQFFSQLVMDEPKLVRSAVGEFVLPVPLGSPRNFLGTGRLGYAADPASVYHPEGLTLSVNGKCTAKRQGDRIAGQWLTSEGCSGAVNPEYRTNPSYEYYIEVPEGRSYATDVLIFDGAYITNSSGRTNPRQESPALPTAAYFAEDFNPGGGRGSSGGVMQTSFELFLADGTPLDDSDNPPMSSLSACAPSNPGADGDATFRGAPDGSYSAAQAKADMTNTSFFPTGSGTAFYNSVYGWWNLCRIPASAPAGRYILRVSHDDTRDRGSNNYAIVANRVGDTGLCSNLTDTDCPKVFAKDHISIRGNSAGRAQFYLAEVGDQHAGKTLRIELWDPAEGGRNIRLLQPTGTLSWGYVSFDWFSSDGNSGSNTTAVPVSSFDFDGDLLTLEYQLPADYDPPPANAWWKVEYEYSSGRAVTDRTTWSVKVIGDPVHLVE